MAIFDNYASAVVSALRSRGITGDCPMCKKKEWVLHGVPVCMPVYEISGEIKFPGTSMPMAAMLCRSCGFAGFYSLGALGLLQKNAPQQETAEPAPAAPEPAAAK